MVLMKEAGDTQISITWNDLDQKRVEEDFCEGCKTKRLRQMIEKLSMIRLQNEGRLKDERLSDPSDPFFEKPLEYALAIYSYYQCFSCKKPYFGGLRSCEAVA